MIYLVAQNYLTDYWNHLLQKGEESYLFLFLVILALLAVFFFSRNDRSIFDKKLEVKEKEWKEKFLEREKYWSDKNEAKNEELRQCSIEHYKIIGQFTEALKKDGEIISTLSEEIKNLKGETISKLSRKIEKLSEELERQWNP